MELLAISMNSSQQFTATITIRKNFHHLAETYFAILQMSLFLTKYVGFTSPKSCNTAFFTALSVCLLTKGSLLWTAEYNITCNSRKIRNSAAISTSCDGYGFLLYNASYSNSTYLIRSNSNCLDCGYSWVTWNVPSYRLFIILVEFKP